MTAITIDRKVLEQALNALLLPCDRWNGGQFLIVNAAVNSVQNALEAPVAAPAKELRSRDKSGRAVMITITIDRKLLEEVVELFDSAITARHPHEILRDIRAALAAPATAPAQPAWHDAPTVPGLWACRQFITDRVQAYEVTDEVAFNKNLGLKGRWYGPIPPDGDKP